MAELGDLDKLNQTVKAQGGEVIGINTETLDDNADANGTQTVSERYLEYLYSDEAQRLIGVYGYRPSNQKILEEFSDVFDLNINLWSIDDFGGWDNAYETYFDDGALFDQIYNHS